MKSLQRYKIGLALLGVFTVILLVLLIAQAGSHKSDQKTYERAYDIANDLDSYVISNGIPESLNEAGIDDVPDEVSYEKLSSTRYKFCVTYKAESSTFDSSEVWLSALYGVSYDDYYDDDGESSYLYLPPTHKKGENCQTVTDNYSSYDEDDYYDEYDTPESLEY